MKYGLVLNGNVIRIMDFNDPPAVLAQNKGRWLSFSGTEPYYNNEYQYLEGPNYIISDTEILQTWSVLYKDLTLIKNDRKNDLASYRYEKEILGIIWRGYPFDTLREVRSILTGAGVLAQMSLSQGQSFNMNWKCANGTFVSLDSMSILMLIKATAEYVSACYEIEAIKGYYIDSALTAEDVIGVDFTSGWPNRNMGD